MTPQRPHAEYTEDAAPVEIVERESWFGQNLLPLATIGILVISQIFTWGGWFSAASRDGATQDRRLEALEIELRAHLKDESAIYERRDVLEARLKAIDDHLANIDRILTSDPQLAHSRVGGVLR